MILERFAYLPDGTLGCIQIPQGPRIFTIERPWRNNESFVSCIPEGVYALEWDTTGRIKNVPRLRGTSPRTQINIHPANHPEELHGCIAPGLQWAIEGQAPKVINSQKALEILLELIFSADQKDGSDMVDRTGNPAVLKITSKRAVL